MPISFLQSESFLNVRTAPGRPSEVAVNSMASVPKNSSRIREPAAEKVLCPEMYYGKAGVTMLGMKSGTGFA